MPAPAAPSPAPFPLPPLLPASSPALPLSPLPAPASPVPLLPPPPSGTPLPPLPEIPSATPHVSPLHLPAPSPTPPHPASPPASPPAVCCTSLQLPPSGTKTTTAAAHTTIPPASLFSLSPSTPDAGAFVGSAPPLPSPSVLSAHHHCSAFPPAAPADHAGAASRSGCEATITAR